MRGPPRPRIRFAPERGWANDPNGPIWLDERYHLFFQQNPDAPTWGEIGWGHAVSDDLASWRELAPALRPVDGAMVYSGSVALDDANRSGLGGAGQPPLVAAYTAHRSEPVRHEVQDLAWSLDGGSGWTRYAGNPVLDRGQADFRDPKLFWHGPSGAWIMATVLPREQRVLIHRSPDLREWREASVFAPPADPGELWECPDLFEVPVEGTAGETRWVLKVDANVSGRRADHGARLYVGEFDGARFRPGQDAFHADQGPDFYAALSWANLPPGHPPTWLAWLNNWSYASQVPAEGWRGAMTLPRALALRASEQGLRLVQRLPASVLKAFGDPAEVAVGDPAAPCAVAVSGTFLVLLGEASATGAWTIGLQSEEKVEARLSYLPGERSLRVERRGTPELASRGFEQPSHVPLRSPAGLQVAVDGGSLELFGDDGETVASFLLALSGPVRELRIGGWESVRVADRG